MITTTTDHIEGYRITEYLGVVFADAPNVRFRNRNINEPEAWHMEYDEEKHPEYLETYAEVLYGLGERVKAEKTFARCMNIYQKECRNRDLRETWETMKKKFSDSVSFSISIP